jgi:hypothetical protein
LIPGQACRTDNAGAVAVPIVQGAFVLLGTMPGGTDIAMLLVMMIALLCYIAWRFGEAFLGQGYDAG